MKPNSFLSFLGGLMACAICMGVVYFLAAFLTFNLAGYESLQQVEAERIGWLILTIFLSGVSLYIAIVCIKKQKKFTAYGILSVAIFVFVFAAIYCSYNITDTQFDKERWEQAGYKPYKMAATLVKKNKLKGLTKKEVLALLGTPYNEYEDESIAFCSLTYQVENEWTLKIYINNNKVDDAAMRLPGMMTICAPLRMIYTV